MKTLLVEWYGSDQEKSADLCRIISEKHFDRLVNLLEKSKGTVAIGNSFRNLSIKACS